MKKNIYLIALLLSSAFFFSCDSDEPNNDGGTYTPDKNLTSTQIIELLQEAIETTKKEQKATETVTRNSDNKKATEKYEIDLVAKKILFMYHINSKTGSDILTDMLYLEDASAYTYEYYNGRESYDVEYMNDYILKNMKLADILDIDLELNFNVANWSVSGNKLLGVVEESSLDEGESYRINVTLDAKKRLKQIEIKEVYINDQTPSTYETTYNYQYSANPQLPKNFTKDMFTRLPQQYIYINWGGSLGTDKYWSDYIYNDGADFSISSLYEAPTIAGKVPVFYEDAAFTQSTGSVYYYGDVNSNWRLYYYAPTDGKTIYAKWINESEVVIPHNTPVKEEAKSPFDILKQKINRIQ